MEKKYLPRFKKFIPISLIVSLALISNLKGQQSSRYVQTVAGTLSCPFTETSSSSSSIGMNNDWKSAYSTQHSFYQGGALGVITEGKQNKMRFWEETPAKKKMMNTPLMGGAIGFAIGGAGGIALGLSGKDWVLSNGKVVSRPIHAIVDMFIVGVPTTIIGVVVGARRDRSTLVNSRLHAAIAGGWSSSMAYHSMINAYDISGLPRHIPHWFGYLHYPNGDNSSTPYTWNLSVDYNLQKRILVGVSFDNFVQQEIRQGTDPHHPGKEYEFAKGESYSVVGSYIINPIKPENKTRLEFAAGAGATVHNLLAGGYFNGIDYKSRKYNVTPYIRGTADYYSRKNLSLQLKFGYRPRQTVRVPEQTDGVRTLVAHAVNFRSLDITLGIRYHLINLN